MNPEWIWLLLAFGGVCALGSIGDGLRTLGRSLELCKKAELEEGRRK